MSTSTKLALFLLAAACTGATTITVCASGCTTTSFQTALNSAAGGDIIELKAGETFTGTFVVPWRAGGGRVTVRSSRWRELPPLGTRLTSAHSSLMPELRPPDGSSQVLTMGPYEQYPSSVDTSTDVITFGGTHGFSDGQPIACWNDDGTIPVVANQIYYVRDSTSTTLKLANTPGGAAVDLTTTPTATRFRCSIARAPSGWKFTGVNFATYSGGTQYTLVDLGTVEATNRAGLPSDVELDRVWIHGRVEENGPRLCLFINARNWYIHDSTIEHCVKEGEEGKAIGMVQAPGPGRLENNYIAAGAINMLIGGDYVRIVGLVSGDEGGITITGNHFTRPYWTKYTYGVGGSGAPMGACGGGYHLDTASGLIYDCQGGSWVAVPTCVDGEYYRRTDVTQSCVGGACWHCSSGVYTSHSVFRGSGYNTKNLFELKSAVNVNIFGNVFERNWVNSDQSGVGVWVFSKVGQGNANGWVQGANIRVHRNLLRRSAQGWRIATEGGTTFGYQNERISVTDNLAYALGTNDECASCRSNDSKPMSFAGPCNDCQFEHNTMVSGTTGGSGFVADTAAMTRFRLANNISNNNQYGVTYDNGLSCTFYLPSPSQWYNSIFVNNDTSTWSSSSCATNLAGISNATTLFVGGGNYRLQATSPYSASCASGCAFTGTDGRDLGADVDAVLSSTGGAVSGAPWLGGSIQVDAGSVNAVIRYTAPSASSCTVKIYTSATKTTLHADTDTGPEQADTRTGSVTVGSSRQFVAGTSAALTPSTMYPFVVTCGSEVGSGRIITAAAGSGTYYARASYGTAVAGEYSASADMSSPTSISSSTSHTIPISTGNVRYYRKTGGSIRAFVAR